MTDQEISRRLALSIGYKPEQLLETSDGLVFITYSPHNKVYSYRREFDYRDPSVIWPIAERFECFPAKTDFNGWAACVLMDVPPPQRQVVFADTPAEAVALAVIKARGKP